MAERKLKSPIKKYSDHLTPEQQQAKKTIDSHILTIIDGKAGSGKTHIAVCYALEQLALNKIKQSDIERIVITRATVMRKDHNTGFLPGDIQEKFNPWLRPIYDNMLPFFQGGQGELDGYVNDRLIEIVPLAYLQGRTFTNSVIIVDEAENLDDFEIEMLFTRIGKGSKMIMCGDLRQHIVEGKSGLESLTYICNKSKNVARVTLTVNFRSPIVEELLELYNIYVWSNGKEGDKTCSNQERT